MEICALYNTRVKPEPKDIVTFKDNRLLIRVGEKVYISCDRYKDRKINLDNFYVHSMGEFSSSVDDLSKLEWMTFEEFLRVG